MTHNLMIGQHEP